MATILTKKSDTASAVPLAADLTNAAGGAELAVNATDKRLFSKTSGGSVVELGTNPSSLTMPNGTANGVAYLNGSKVVTSGSALTFDGNVLALSQAGATGLTLTSTASQAYINLRSVATSGFEPFVGFGDASAGNIGQMIGINGGGLRWTTNGSEQMRLNSTGLGIGTSSPSNKLHINSGASTTAALIESTGTSVFTGLKNSGSIAYIGSDSTGAFLVQTPGSSFSTKLTLDSSGNLGLGVTPSAWFSVYKPMQLGSYGAAIAGQTNAQTLSLWNNAYPNASNVDTYTTTNAANKFRMDGGAFQFFTAPSGIAGNAITFTQAMTLDASGNWILGGTSASGRARIVGAASTDCGLNIDTSTNNYASFININALNDNGAIYNYIRSTTSGGTEHWKISGGAATSTMSFSTGGTERARIDSSGNLLVGTTGNVSNARFKAVGSGSNMVAQLQVGADANYAIGFSNSAASTVGNITVNTSSTAYNTSSDYRLKNTIAPMTGALAKVALLKPCTYKWNADGSDGQGFIAHELAEVCPHAVTGEKDAVDENGNPKYQGIDTSFLVATLTAALQELNAKFDAYVASHP